MTDIRLIEKDKCGVEEGYFSSFVSLYIEVSIEIPKSRAALWAAEPKPKGHSFGCPFGLTHHDNLDIFKR